MEDNLVSIIAKKDKIIDTLLSQNKELKRRCRKYADLKIGEHTYNRYNEILREENKKLKERIKQVERGEE